MTASGDPFGSRHFRYVMKRLARRDYRNLLLEIQTNGVLFTPAAWAEFDLAGRLALDTKEFADLARAKSEEVIAPLAALLKQDQAA